MHLPNTTRRDIALVLIILAIVFCTGAASVALDKHQEQRGSVITFREEDSREK